MALARRGDVDEAVLFAKVKIEMNCNELTKSDYCQVWPLVIPFTTSLIGLIETLIIHYY